MRKLFLLAGNLVALTAAFGLLARYVSPEVFWPPAIIALLLPGLLLLTLLFLCIQLARKRWASLIFPALVLLLSWPVVNRLLAWPTQRDPPPLDSPTVTVVTGNQRMFRHDDRTDATLEEVRNFFSGTNTDILLLQETWPRQRNKNYISAMQEGTGLEERHQRDKTLIATYADGIVGQTEYFQDSEYHGILLTDVQTELGTLRIINSHLQSNRISDMAEGISGENSLSNQLTTFGRMLAGYGRTTRQRAAQAQQIRRFVEESPYPVILGGDFNDVPSSYMYNEILSPRLQDAWVQAGTGLGTTFTGPLPGLRIDYFMVDTSLSVVSMERLSSPWSDHRPLRLVVTQ